MRRAAFTALCLAASLFTGAAFAADARLDRCVADNSDATVSAEVIAKYCACMSEKMGPTETLSVTKWEKNHKVERKACDKAADWN